MSTITKHRYEREFAVRLGHEIRARRRALGMTQAELGRPLTRGFVSAVEHGHCVPSLPALLLFAHRLRISAGDLLDPVNRATARLYTAPHGRGQVSAHDD